MEESELVAAIEPRDALEEIASTIEALKIRFSDQRFALGLYFDNPKYRKALKRAARAITEAKLALIDGQRGA